MRVGGWCRCVRLLAWCSSSSLLLLLLLSTAWLWAGSSRAGMGCEEMGVLQRLWKDLEPASSPASRGAAVLTAGGAGLGDDRDSSSVVLLIARWEDEQPCKPAWCWL